MGVQMRANVSQVGYGIGVSGIWNLTRGVPGPKDTQ
jgi:hypothetical protein